VQRLLKREKVDHFFTQNEQKSSYAERAIKTIKSKLSRYMSRHQTHHWIDVLDSVTQSYNGSYHRSIKMAPRAVTKKDETRLWKLQYTTRQYAKAPTRRYAFSSANDFFEAVDRLLGYLHSVQFRLIKGTLYGVTGCIL
jgi:hypothetical protein